MKPITFSNINSHLTDAGWHLLRRWPETQAPVWPELVAENVHQRDKTLPALQRKGIIEPVKAWQARPLVDRHKIYPTLAYRLTPFGFMARRWVRREI